MILFVVNLLLIFFYSILWLRELLDTLWSIPASITLASLIYLVETYDSRVIRVLSVFLGVALGVGINYSLLGVTTVAFLVSDAWLDGWTTGTFLAGVLSLKCLICGQRVESLTLWLATASNSILLTAYLASV